MLEVEHEVGMVFPGKDSFHQEAYKSQGRAFGAGVLGLTKVRGGPPHVLK